jgi:hypothetical protein
MKTVKKNEEIKRVSDKTAEDLVANKGFSYCQKKEWKTAVRDVVKEKKTTLIVVDTSQNLSKEEMEVATTLLAPEKKKISGRQRQKQLGEN